MSRVKVKDAGGTAMNAVDVGGYLLPGFYMEPGDIRDIYKNVPNFFCRQDDIMLCGYPKTGMNWVFEIIMMLLNKSSAPVMANKISTMLENSMETDVSDLPSPRVLNTHLPVGVLPKDLKTKQIKTFLVVRNPKDTAVSYYHHMTGLKQYKYTGEWKHWLESYITGKFEYGKYTDYLLGWENRMKTGMGFPLHVVYYEDLKKDPMGEVRRMADFLGSSVDTDVVRDIVINSSFQKMAKDKIPTQIKEYIFRPDFEFFRKGEVGDWKNWFTTEQNRRFDQLWSKETKNSHWTFTYALDSSKL